MTGSAPQKLTADLAAGASFLITMGCGDECPVVPGAVRDDSSIRTTPTLTGPASAPRPTSSMPASTG